MVKKVLLLLTCFYFVQLFYFLTFAWELCYKPLSITNPLSCLANTVSDSMWRSPDNDHWQGSCCFSFDRSPAVGQKPEPKLCHGPDELWPTLRRTSILHEAPFIKRRPEANLENRSATSQHAPDHLTCHPPRLCSARPITTHPQH